MSSRKFNQCNILFSFDLRPENQRFPFPLMFFMSPFNTANISLTHLRHSLSLPRPPLVPLHHLSTHPVELERLFVVI